MDQRIGLIPEDVKKRSTSRKRLGRHVQFDERSRAFRVQAPGAPLVSKLWPRRLKPLNQGATGSCTGNALVGVLATEPYARPGTNYTQTLARKVYAKATELDSISGIWPPTDTGSTVLCAMKAAQSMGLITGYSWCFGADDVLRTLSTIGPVEIGLNWYSGFDKPMPRSGLVKASGIVQGGHAFELHGLDVQKELVWAYNSWGAKWGVKGRFCFSFETLRRLLKEDGEAVAPIVAE